MRCFSLKGLLVLFSVWHVSQQMKDLLENIHPSDENSFELNSFLQDVIKMKRSFKEIRNAVSDLDEVDDSMSEDRIRNEDIDEYIYDEENLEANRKKIETGEHQEVNKKLSYIHKSDRPSNDIYPHVYKGHADHEFKSSDKNFDLDKAIRFRRQLVEDVQVEPKSTKGNIEVLGERTSMIDKSSLAESTPNDVRETLMAIFSELIKATTPTQTDISMSSESVPTLIKTPHLANTPSTTENVFLITNPHNLGKQPQNENVDKSKLRGEENKKTMKIKIMEDGKIIKEYSSGDKEKENQFRNDMSTGSPVSFHLIPSAEVQKEVSPKLDDDMYNKNNGDATKPDLDNFEKDKNTEIPTVESETNENFMSNELEGNLPILVGNRMKNNNRLTIPENIRPHSYNTFIYPRRIDQRYSNIPNEKFYQHGYKFPYHVNLRPQLQIFKIKDEQSDNIDYPSNVNYYQLRRLKALNETLPHDARKKRSIQELLGLNNEDDYAEDLDFSTEISITSKILEDEVECIDSRSNYKSTEGKGISSFSKDLHSSIKSAKTDAPMVSTAISTLEIQYDSPETMTAITQNALMKRDRKYRKMKKRKNIDGMIINSKHDLDNTSNDKSKKNCKRDDMSGGNESDDLKYGNRVPNGRQISSEMKPGRTQNRQDVSEKLRKKSIDKAYENNYDYKFPQLVTYMNDYNEYFRNRRLVEPEAVNFRMRGSLYQKKIPANPNEMFVRRQFHFVPFIPLEYYYQEKFPSCVHFYPLNFEIDNKRHFEPFSNKQNSYTFNSRKLMTNSDVSKDNPKNDIRSDIRDVDESKRSKDTLKKRTESDYGEEPDLSEGQTIKKHSKLKKYNKIDAPAKNFEDNYEFEETANENGDLLESERVDVGKHIKNNSKLKKKDHHSSQLSFKERLAKLKNKLFSSESNEIDKALRDEQPYESNYEYSNRIERQPEQAPISYELQKVLNPLIGVPANSNIEPPRTNDPYYCPDVLSSEDPYMNPSDSSSRSCKSHTCRWHFNPLSGSFEACSCPCEPCPLPTDPPPCPCPCPCEPPPPCNPCSCPPTCNPCPSLTTSSSTKHGDAYSTVKERSSEDSHSSCTCDQCPCPNPKPCPDEPCPCPSSHTCEPCPCPKPCPCPCSIPSTDEEKKIEIAENALDEQLHNPYRIDLGAIEADDTENKDMRIENNNDISPNTPCFNPSREYFPSNSPRNQFQQMFSHSRSYPRETIEVSNYPVSDKSDNMKDKFMYPPYDTNSYQSFNIRPYLIDDHIYPYSPGLKNTEIFENVEKKDSDSRMLDENYHSALNYPYSYACPCPQPHPTYYPYPYYSPHFVASIDNEEVLSSSPKKRADISEDIQQPNIQRPSTAPNICPCVFGYFFPFPHMNSSPNMHYNSDISPHIASDADDISHHFENAVPHIDSKVSSSSGHRIAQPLSQSPEEHSSSKTNYIACCPSIPLQNIFLSQSDSDNKQKSPDDRNVIDTNDIDSESIKQVAKSNKRSVSRQYYNVFPYSYENSNPIYSDNFQDARRSKVFSLKNPETSFVEPNPFHSYLTDFEPSEYNFPHQSYGMPYRSISDNLQPIIMPPSSSYIADSDLNVNKVEKLNRRCPKPNGTLPPYAVYPSSHSIHQAGIKKDILVEKAKRVNEYLKKKFLNGQYSMNNMMFSRNKRQLPFTDSSSKSISEDMIPALRRIRRKHGVPRNHLHRKMPIERDNKRDEIKYVKNAEEDVTTESLIPYLINENEEYDQFHEEEFDSTKNVDRKSRSFLDQETNSNKLKPEKAKDVKKKNSIELQDLHFAKEIIDTVIDKVNKNPNLKIKIGNALNKKKIYEAESSQRNHAKESSSKEQTESEEAKNLLRSVSCVLNKLVKKQIQEKLCEHLPTHLRNFLKHIVRPPGHRIKQRSNDKYHEDTFLFRTSYPPEKLDSKTRKQLKANLNNLLNRYNELDEESKKKAAPVKSYIVSHLDMLKKIKDEQCKNQESLVGHDKNEHLSRHTTDEEKSISFKNPVKFGDSSNNLDLMGGNVENLDFGKEATSFEKIDINFSTPPKPIEDGLETKLKKRDAKDGNYKSVIKTEGVKEKTANKNNKVSDKYKKLVDAAEEIRCKRKNEEKIGEAFGRNSVRENEDSPGSQNTIR